MNNVMRLDEKMTDIRKVIKKIRGAKKPPQKLETKVEKIIAARKAEKYKAEFWERDKKIVRDENFKKAVMTRNKNIEERRATKEAEEIRQEEIAKERMKNLRKAQRALKKRRENGISS